MAKSTSFNKRELEKKKEQKRKEKQKRKEERKAKGISSYDDMIAYVDQSGRLSSLPPDPDQKQEIDLEDIIVSTPKKEETEIEPLRGRVEHFNPEKGFGFIKDADSINKYFFHISNAPLSIAEGNMVTFELERGQRGMNAVRIVIVK